MPMAPGRGDSYPAQHRVGTGKDERGYNMLSSDDDLPDRDRWARLRFYTAP